MAIKTVAITGGAGFLGMALARRLAPSYRVRILDLHRPADGHDLVLDFRRCDVTDPADCLSALEGVDAVFHRAGLMGNLASMRAPIDYYRVNLIGTLNVLQACVAQRVGRFIFDSTVAVYGRTHDGPIDEERHPEPNSLYAATKFACEAAVRLYDEQHNLSTLIYRYSRTRTAAKHDVITRLARQVLTGMPVKLYDQGEPMIDFVELDDLIEANVLALTSTVRGEVMNISSGEGISFAGLLAAIESAAGRRAVAVAYEELPEHPPLSEHKFGSKRFFMAVEKARRRLGWRPTRRLAVSIADSVALLRRGGA
jgi:UDP-glucose 4-epimerase